MGSTCPRGPSWEKLGPDHWPSEARELGRIQQLQDIELRREHRSCNRIAFSSEEADRAPPSSPRHRGSGSHRNYPPHPQGVHHLPVESGGPRTTHPVPGTRPSYCLQPIGGPEYGSTDGLHQSPANMDHRGLHPRSVSPAPPATPAGASPHSCVPHQDGARDCQSRCAPIAAHGSLV